MLIEQTYTNSNISLEPVRVIWCVNLNDITLFDWNCYYGWLITDGFTGTNKIVVNIKVY